MVLQKHIDYKLSDKEDTTIYLVVEFNGEEIEEIIEVSITDNLTNNNINLINILSLNFSNVIDEMIDSVNWYELYREKKIKLN